MLRKLYQTKTEYTTAQLAGLVVLRVLIGWHFLYEGVAKLLNPYWTSASYLLESKGPFAGFFHYLANHPSVLKVVDPVNVWALILIGLALLCGLLSQVASIGGMLLLLLYYLCTPPFVGYHYSIPMEGSYLIVNKVLIELAALYVLTTFPTSQLIGLDRLVFGKSLSEGED